VQLHRKLRQRYYSQLNWRGEIEVVQKPDFPLSREMFDEWTIAEVEEWERKAWREGWDVEELVRQAMDAM
jgi:hypothetical protein